MNRTRLPGCIKKCQKHWERSIGLNLYLTDCSTSPENYGDSIVVIIPQPTMLPHPFLVCISNASTDYGASHETSKGKVNHSAWKLTFRYCSRVALECNEVEVNLRPRVNRPVRPGFGHPSGTRDKRFLLLDILFRQFWVRHFVAPSLTRGRVYNLLYNCFWALLKQSLLCRSPA
jgi:hypothetical protein